METRFTNLHLGELGEDLREFVMERLLEELDLARVEGTDTTDGVLSAKHDRLTSINPISSRIAMAKRATTNL